MKNLYAEKIREIRKRHRLTQWQLSQRIKMSDAYIAQLETGKRIPCMLFAIKLRMVLNEDITKNVIEDLTKKAEAQLRTTEV